MKNILKALTLLAFFSFIFTSCGTPPKPPVEKPAPEVVEEPQDVPVKEYTVVAGDTLSQIALKFYGTREKAYYFPIIMAINPGKVKHPDKLTPKLKLLIPDFELFMQHSLSKEKAKPEFEKCIKIYEDEGRSGVVESLRRRLKEF